jgi:O-antigen ligase
MEVGFCLVIVYSIFGEHIISVPMLGAASLGLLTVMCLTRLSARAVSVLKAISPALACAGSFVAVQLLVHRESLLDGNVRAVVTWTLGLIAAQCLALRRGFLHRFAIWAFAIGLAMLPFISFRAQTVELARAGIEGLGLSNPNSVGMWFGFCAVYAIVSGIEAKTVLGRVLWIVAGAACMYMVGMTVSRGPVLGIAMASVVALRQLLKRGFIPVLLLSILGCGIFMTGVFDSVVASYAERGTESTGREALWPAAVRRFVESPIVGVGVSDVSTATSGRNPKGPHNGVIYVALASGIVPLFLFLAFWKRALAAAIRVYKAGISGDPFVLPLMIFALLEMMLLDTAFMSPWHLVAVAHGLTAAVRVQAAARQRRHLMMAHNASWHAGGAAARHARYPAPATGRGTAGSTVVVRS